MNSPLHPVHRAYADALAEQNPMAVIPLGRTVLCDDCDRDCTASAEGGGILFQSKAIGPCCAPKWEASAERYGETSFIRAHCPAGVSFADWVRGMRGPDPAITISPLYRDGGS